MQIRADSMPSNRNLQPVHWRTLMSLLYLVAEVLETCFYYWGPIVDLLLGPYCGCSYGLIMLRVGMHLNWLAATALQRLGHDCPKTVEQPLLLGSAA